MSDIVYKILRQYPGLVWGSLAQDKNGEPLFAYDRSGINKPVIGCFLAFNTLSSAIEFNSYLRPSTDTIWECEAELTDPRTVPASTPLLSLPFLSRFSMEDALAELRSYWTKRYRYLQGKSWYNIICAPPGTVYCDSIQLLEQYRREE